MLPTAVCTVVQVVLCSALLPPTLFGRLPLLRPPPPPQAQHHPLQQCVLPLKSEVLPAMKSCSSPVSCRLPLGSQDVSWLEGCLDQRAFPAAAPPDWLQETADEGGLVAAPPPAGTRVFPVEPEPEWDRAPPCKVCLWTRIGKRKGLFGLVSAFFIYFVSKTFFLCVSYASSLSFEMSCVAFCGFLLLRC